MHTESKKTRNHELRAVADGVDRAILDNNTLVAREEGLQGRDDGAQVGLITVVVLEPLRVKDVVQSDKVLGLVHGSGTDTAKLLHVSTNTKQQTQMNTESTDVSAGLAAHPEYTKLPLIVELVEFALVDGTDTELTLDGRNERGTLEQGASQCLERTRKLSLSSRKLIVETNNANVFLSGALLGLDKACSAIDAHDQTSSNLGVESTTVASLFNSSVRVSKIRIQTRSRLRTGGSS